VKEEFNALPMISTHCPICRRGPLIDCSDMERCPLVLAKYRGVFITPGDFAAMYGVTPASSAVALQPSQTNPKGYSFDGLLLGGPGEPPLPAISKDSIQFTLF